MANALGTLFKDIANAIREKSGETSAMKPAEFPDKIAAIEGGGSGGGTLPVGAYWSESGLPQPNRYCQVRFVFQGELYAIAQNGGSNAATGNMYKLVDGTWTTLFTDFKFVCTIWYICLTF